MDITKIFAELNYTIYGINGECPPCSIVENGRLIGFVREDLTVDIAEGASQHREKIESIIKFGCDNFGRDEFNENEYSLISYNGYFVTTSFDTKEGIPIYNLYKETDEGYSILDTYKRNQQAMKAFSEQSKLLLFLESESNEREQKIPSYFDIFKNASEQIGLKIKASFSKLGILLHLRKDNTTVATVDKDLNVIVEKGIEKGLEKAIEEKVIKKAEEIQSEKKATHRVVPKKMRKQTAEREAEQSKPQSTLENQIKVTEAPQKTSQEKFFMDVEINEENFPDINFRQYISERYDRGDGVISNETIRKTTEMILMEENIRNFQGIEYFENLKFLSCSKNELSELDVSKNRELEILLCGDNYLNKLDVSQNSKLKTFDCHGNNLKELDLSYNPKLKHLDCSENQLRELSVRQNYGLESLNCSNNSINELELDNNAELNFLNCEYNQIGSLDLRGNEYLGNTKIDSFVYVLDSASKLEKKPEKEIAYEIN